MMHTFSLHCRQHGPSGEYVTWERHLPGPALPSRGDTIFVFGWSLDVLYSALFLEGKDVAVEIRLDFLDHNEYAEFAKDLREAEAKP